VIPTRVRYNIQATVLEIKTNLSIFLLMSIPIHAKEHKTLFTFLKVTSLNWMNKEHPNKFYQQELGMISKHKN
jgi:hypothetical protein